MGGPSSGMGSSDSSQQMTLVKASGGNPASGSGETKATPANKVICGALQPPLQDELLWVGLIRGYEYTILSSLEGANEYVFLQLSLANYRIYSQNFS